VDFYVYNLTDQNFIHEAIKDILNSGNICYHSVQSLSSSRLLYRNVKLKIYKSIILSVLCVGVKRSLTLREEHRLRVFENSVLRRMFVPKWDEVTRNLADVAQCGALQFIRIPKYH
jgi:hypothetical protein